MFLIFLNVFSLIKSTSFFFHITLGSGRGWNFIFSFNMMAALKFFPDNCIGVFINFEQSCELSREIPFNSKQSFFSLFLLASLFWRSRLLLVESAFPVLSSSLRSASILRHSVEETDSKFIARGNRKI